MKIRKNTPKKLVLGGKKNWKNKPVQSDWPFVLVGMCICRTAELEVKNKMDNWTREKTQVIQRRELHVCMSERYGHRMPPMIVSKMGSQCFFIPTFVWFSAGWLVSSHTRLRAQRQPHEPHSCLHEQSLCSNDQFPTIRGFLTSPAYKTDIDVSFLDIQNRVYCRLIKRGYCARSPTF